MNKKNIVFCFLIYMIPIISFASKKERGEILTDSTQITIHKIIIGGNKKTKAKVILRELLFKTGDTIYLEYLENHLNKSKENLLNTSLFNYVTLNTIEDDESSITIYVLVEERWYLWPYLIFEQADRNLSAFLHNRDWSRINYGLMLVKNNFRGRGEKVKLKFRLGYKEQFQLAYEIPYLGKSRQHGVSTEFNWFRQNEISYMTDFDQLLYYKEEDNYISKTHSSKIIYQYRNKHYLRHNFSAAYSFIDVNDTIIELNNNYLGIDKSQSEYISIGYTLSLDRRNYKHYPLKGYNFEISLMQKGLNLLPNEMKGIWEVESLGYYYWELNPRWYSGLGGMAKISSNRKQPFFIEEGLGYTRSLRAFEYNVIDGQRFATSRSFIKYAIIPEKIIHIEGWSWSKFNKIHYSLFVNTFIDAGYVYDVNPNPTNKLPNVFLASTGIGIDLVAYYDQIIRLEYSINRFGDHGFFLHIGKAF